MEEAEIITPWIGSGTDGDNWRPKLIDVFAVNQRDVVGRSNAEGLPDPANVTINVKAPTATIDAIAADNDYYILWRG